MQIAPGTPAVGDTKAPCACGQPVVVVVNDDSAQLRLAVALLVKEGVATVPCESAEEALRVLNLLGSVDAIVTDLHMPGIDGWRLCRLLRSPEYPAFNQTPILVVSATFSGVDAEQVTTDLGANAFLPSPCEPAELISCVRDLLAGRTPQAAMHALILDSDAVRSRAVQRAFDAHGYITHVATTADEGLHAFRKRAAEVAVIAHPLPGMDAAQLLRHLKQPGSSTVAIVITNDLSPEVALDLVRFGADGYVREPFVPEYLVDLSETARRARALIRIEELLEDRTRQLRESEAQLRALFESIPEAVIVHDDDGVILYINAVGARQLETSVAQLIGTNLRDYLILENDAQIARHAQRTHATGFSVFETVCVARSGRRIEVGVNSKPIEFDRRPAILSIARDITSRKQLEQQRADFMAMLAHDIRNPLAVVTGYVDMLLTMGKLDPEQEDILRRIETNSQSAVALVSNYLDLSKIEAGLLTLDSRPVRLDEIVRRVCQRLESEARRRDLVIEPHLDEALLHADPLALERVFSNLIHNALKFTPAHGRITISTGQQDGTAFGVVRDTGPGIAPDEVSLIFERYRVAKTSGHPSGTGLGLFIARALVEAHGGSIMVDTVLGRGTSFTVRLPSAAAAASAA